MLAGSAIGDRVGLDLLRIGDVGLVAGSIGAQLAMLAALLLSTMGPRRRSTRGDATYCVRRGARHGSSSEGTMGHRDRDLQRGGRATVDRVLLVGTRRGRLLLLGRATTKRFAALLCLRGCASAGGGARPRVWRELLSGKRQHAELLARLARAGRQRGSPVRGRGGEAGPAQRPHERASGTRWGSECDRRRLPRTGAFGSVESPCPRRSPYPWPDSGFGSFLCRPLVIRGFVVRPWACSFAPEPGAGCGSTSVNSSTPSAPPSATR